MLEGQTFIEVFPDYTVPDNLKYVPSFDKQMKQPGIENYCKI